VKQKTNEEELKTKLWRCQIDSKYTTQEQRFWKVIGTSLACIIHANRQFNNPEIHPEIAIGYGKLFIMELWTIKTHVEKLKLDISQFNKIAPRLVDWRDSYAHLEERTNRVEVRRRKLEVPLKGEKKSIAGGLLTRTSEGNWDIQGPCKLYNFEFNGQSGAMSIFGSVNDYMICNSANDLLEIQINEALLDRIMVYLGQVANSPFKTK
jgi:hypothetical protein